MDEAARTAFRARWREQIEGDPTRSRIYKDIAARHRHRRHRVLPAAFFDADRHDLRLPRRRQRRVVLHGEVDEALKQLLDRHPRAPPLPAARPRAPDPAARGAVPQARGLLHPRRRASRCCSVRGSRRRWSWARPLPDLSVDRGAHRAAEEAAAAPRQHAAPRADRGREPGPAREPAGAAARPPHRAAERRLAGRVPGRRRAACDRRRPARRAASSGTSPTLCRAQPRSSRHPVRHRDRAVRQLAHRAPAAQAGAGQRRQCADQGPVRAEAWATRWCTPTTASAATWACVNIDLGRRRAASSCTSNTPTRRRCTCRWRSCT